MDPLAKLQLVNDITVQVQAFHELMDEEKLREAKALMLQTKADVDILLSSDTFRDCRPLVMSLLYFMYMKYFAARESMDKAVFNGVKGLDVSLLDRPLDVLQWVEESVQVLNICMMGSFFRQSLYLLRATQKLQEKVQGAKGRKKVAMHIHLYSAIHKSCQIQAEICNYVSRLHSANANDPVAKKILKIFKNDIAKDPRCLLGLASGSPLGSLLSSNELVKLKNLEVPEEREELLQKIPETPAESVELLRQMKVNTRDFLESLKEFPEIQIDKNFMIRKMAEVRQVFRLREEFTGLDY